MRKLKTFESYFSNLFKKQTKKVEQKPEKQKPSPVIQLINYFEQDTIKNLHDFGYSDANRENIYTNEIYGFHFKNRLEKQLGRNSNVDKLIYDIISNIKGYEDYILNKNIDKYNL